ncbi:MAG TPA: opine dehydrogenase [Propionibacterium sp.]|nr:opine dehydrogenase [Propionibacterium sp.]
MRLAILGSGNGGTAAAFEWAQAGHEVALWDFTQFGGNVAAIAASGHIEGRVKFEGRAPIRYAGHDLARALEGAELVLIVGPAYAHEEMGEALRGHLSTDAAYCMLPSGCNGAIVLKKALGLDILDDTYVIGETSTLPYGCRLVEPGVVRVTTRVLDGLFVAAVPSSRTPELLAKLQVVWPQAEAAANVLQTTLQNGNPVLHPAIMLLNASRIENTGGDFLFYTEGVTPASARLMAAVDEERIALGRALGVRIVPDPELGVRQGYLSEATWLKGYNQGIGFAKSQAPSTLDFRYLTEDVPYGLVFISELAKQFHVPTPAVDTVISLASIVLDTDFRAQGRRLPADLGFGELTPDQVRGL